MTRTVPIEIEPITAILADRKTYSFLLLTSGFNRLKRRFNVKTIPELFGVGQENIPIILFESLMDRGDMTEEQFTEILPYHPKQLGDLLTLLFGASLPEPEANPTEALGTTPAASQLTN